jgi:hypothetical protein
LLANEALNILGLKSDATPAEIKEAYRDLVKVWHPDRFVDDPRLRKKAEDKLKQLNQASETLRSNPTTAPSQQPAPKPAAHPNRPPAPPPGAPPIHRNQNVAAQKIAVARALFFYTTIAIAIVALVMFAAYVVHLNQTEPAATLPPASSKSLHAQIPNQARPETDASVPSSTSHVHNLTDAETAQLESTCSALRDQPDSTAYQTCLNAQLALITNAPGPPDLSPLSLSERESIESACSRAARIPSSDAYNHCLTAQMADLAASPERPDLTHLSEADRTSIETACARAKSQGPLAYDRCEIRLIQLLASAR